MARRQQAAKSGPGRLYSAAEVIDVTGITRQMLYNYLAIGLIRPGGATPGGRNLYGEECVRRIGLIRRLNRSGYTLRDIRDIFMQEDA